jgi:putative transcriptional regulator
MKSLRGHLLIASRQLLDPNFVRTVVLMIQHSDEGALGVVLNRPSGMTIHQACAKVMDKPCFIEGVLHHGGPCEGPLMVVHTQKELSQVEISPGVHFTTERDSIERLLDGEGGPNKFFVGCAGWAPKQLDGELETGSWLTTPATNEHIFETDEELWSRLTTQVTLGKWIDPARIPEDPSTN